MSKTFTLIDLVAEPMYFRDIVGCGKCGGEGRDANGVCIPCGGKGKVVGERYEARTKAMFGAQDFAAYMRMQREYTEAMAVIQGKSDGDLADAGQLLGDVCAALLHLIVPDLPDERVRDIENGYVIQFISWWTKEQQPTAPALSGGEGSPVGDFAKIEITGKCALPDKDKKIVDKRKWD